MGAVESIGKDIFNDVKHAGEDALQVVENPVGFAAKVIKDPIGFVKKGLKSFAEVMIPGGPLTTAILHEVKLPVVGEVMNAGNMIVSHLGGDKVMEIAKSTGNEFMKLVQSGKIDGAAQILDSLSKKTNVPMKQIAASIFEAAADAKVALADGALTVPPAVPIVSDWKSPLTERLWGRLYMAIRLIAWNNADVLEGKSTKFAASCYITSGHGEVIGENLLWSAMRVPFGPCIEMCCQIVSTWPKTLMKGWEVWLGVRQNGEFRIATASVNEGHKSPNAYTCDPYARVPIITTSSTSSKKEKAPKKQKGEELVKFVTELLDRIQDPRVPVTVTDVSQLLVSFVLLTEHIAAEATTAGKASAVAPPVVPEEKSAMQLSAEGANKEAMLKQPDHAEEVMHRSDVVQLANMIHSTVPDYVRDLKTRIAASRRPRDIDDGVHRVKRTRDTDDLGLEHERETVSEMTRARNTKRSNDLGLEQKQKKISEPRVTWDAPALAHDEKHAPARPLKIKY